MYIDSFLLGVLSVVVTEVIAFAIACVYLAVKWNRRNK